MSVTCIQLEPIGLTVYPAGCTDLTPTSQVTFCCVLLLQAAIELQFIPAKVMSFSQQCVVNTRRAS